MGGVKMDWSENGPSENGGDENEPRSHFWKDSHVCGVQQLHHSPFSPKLAAAAAQQSCQNIRNILDIDNNWECIQSIMTFIFLCTNGIFFKFKDFPDNHNKLLKAVEGENQSYWKNIGMLGCNKTLPANISCLTVWIKKLVVQQQWNGWLQYNNFQQLVREKGWADQWPHQSKLLKCIHLKAGTQRADPVRVDLKREICSSFPGAEIPPNEIHL